VSIIFRGGLLQLVINSPGTYISQKDECFRLKQGQRTFDISPLKVESIVISNQALISTQAIALALEHNIDIIFLDIHGDPMGRVWFSKMGSTALIRRKQLNIADGGLGFKIVAGLISKKLEAQEGFLKKLMYSRPTKKDYFTQYISVIKQARESLGEIPDNQDIEIVRGYLMGIEGSAGRAYFQCLSGLMPEKYRFEGRSRRPAKDPFNATLNYCYGMLYPVVEKACILSGLDPYVGLMHTDNYNKKSLIFDLIEPFRIYADTVSVYLFTGKKMQDDFFDSQEEAVFLNTKGKPVVVEAMNKYLDEQVRYRRRNVKRRHIIQHEAHRLANILLEDSGLNRSDWLDIKEF